MNRKLSLILLSAGLLGALTTLTTPACATDSEDTLKRLLRRFVRVAAPRAEAAAEPAEGDAAAEPAKPEPAAAPRIVLFPFYGEDTLARRRVPDAVSRMLADQIERSAKFELVRTEAVNKRARRLAADGELKGAEAATAGKAAGARYLILGEVTRRGMTYLFFARLLDAESSRQLATETVELPMVDFEADAKQHLRSVPDRRWGFYLAGDAGTGGATKSFPSTSITDTANGTGYSLKVSPTGSASGGGELVGAGLGFRYAPRSWLLFDLGASIGGLSSGSDYTVAFATGAGSGANGGGSGSNTGGSGDTDLVMLRFSTNWTPKISKSWRGLVGVGGMLMDLNSGDNGGNCPSQGYGSGASSINVVACSDDENKTLVIPFARLGLEAKGRRFGWGLFGQFLMGKTTYESGLDAEAQRQVQNCGPGQSCNGETLKSQRVKIFSVDVPQVLAQMTFSFYF